MSKRFFNPIVIVASLMAVIIGLMYIPGARVPWMGMVVFPLLFLLMMAAVVWHFVQTAKRAVEGIRKIGTPEERRIFGFRKSKFLLICGSLFVIVMFLYIEVDARSWTIYQQGLQDVRDSPAATAALGNELNPSWFSNSAMETPGDHGDAAIDLKICGNRGTGRLYIKGIESGGHWKIVDLFIIQKGSGVRIDVAH